MTNQPTGLLAVNNSILSTKARLERLIEKNIDMDSDEYKKEWVIILKEIEDVQKVLQECIDSMDPIAKSKQLDEYSTGRAQYAQAKLQEVRNNILVLDFGRTRQPATLVEAAEFIKDADDRWKEAVNYLTQNMEKLAPDVQTIVKSAIQAIEGKKESRSRAA